MRKIANHINADADKIFKYAAISSEGMWNPIYGIRDRGPFQGNCLRKDTQAFLRWGETIGIDMSLLRTIIDVNDKFIKKLGHQKYKFITETIHKEF